MPNRNITRKLFDKKNSVTFNLVHRSQRDPLTTDGNAPQRVLVPICDVKKCKKDKKYEVFFDNEYEYLKHLKDSAVLSNNLEKVGYLSNYIRNESIKDKSNIILPSSVFESNIQEKIGFLNRITYNSGLKLDLDPEIIAALNDEFDFNDTDNQLEDNFIELADKEDCTGICLNNITCTNTEKKGEVDTLIYDQYTFQDEDTKSCFTEYSISSNVIKRNNQLNLLDQKFEKIYANYDENEIGGLKDNEIEGHIEPNSNIILLYAKEYEDQQKQKIDNITMLMQDQMQVIDRKSYSLDKTEDNIISEKYIKYKKQDKWDCESILSIYNNIYNNPKVISEQKEQFKIKLDYKTGIPKNVLRKSDKLAIQNLVQFKIEENKFLNDEPVIDKNIMKAVKPVLNSRIKTETLQEKKKRKNSVKHQKKQSAKKNKSIEEVKVKEVLKEIKQLDMVTEFKLALLIFDGKHYSILKKRIIIFLKLKKCEEVIQRQRTENESETMWNNK